MSEPKYETRLGLHIFDKPMTREQAQRLGERLMPKDLKAARFETVVFTSVEDQFQRINWGKK